MEDFFFYIIFLQLSVLANKYNKGSQGAVYFSFQKVLAMISIDC